MLFGVGLYRIYTAQSDFAPIFMNEKRIQELNELMTKLNYSFTDPALLNTALTHSSFVKGENRATIHKERKELLVDAVLEL